MRLGDLGNKHCNSYDAVFVSSTAAITVWVLTRELRDAFCEGQYVA